MHFSHDPDEEQWIICANFLVDNPTLFFKHFLINDFGRFFTYLPLAFFRIFTDYISYDSARILMISMFISIIYIQNKIIRINHSKEISTIICSMLALFFGISSHYDLINYNSEMPCILIISTIILLFLRLNNNVKHHNLFFLGFLNALIIYTKEQATLIALFIGLMITIYFLSKKQYLYLIRYYIGGFVGVALLIIPLLLFFGIDEVINYYVNYWEYANYTANNQPYNLGIYHYFELYLKSLVFNRELFFLYFLILTSLGLLIYRVFKSKQNLKATNFFIIGLAIIILYTIYFSHNYLFHYNLYLISVSGYLLSWLLDNYSFNFSKIKVNLILLTSLFFIQSNAAVEKRRLFSIVPQLCLTCSDAFIQADSVNLLLQKFTNPGDGMIIWGYENKYFVRNKLQRASGYLYPTILIGDYSQKGSIIKKYQKEIMKFKPKIFIILVGKNRHWFNDVNKDSIELNAPDLLQTVKANYNLVAKGEDYILYLRK